MDKDILSFSVSTSEEAAVEVFPSVTLELAYAFYFLSSSKTTQGRDLPYWLIELHKADSDLQASIRTFCSDLEGSVAKYTLSMVGGLGYTEDQDPRRFLNDLPGLPAELLSFLDAQNEVKKKHQPSPPVVREQLSRLQKAEVIARFQMLLEQLWRVLEPLWHREGHTITQEASRTFKEELERTGDVLKALPAHHFTQFEASAEDIRASQAKGRLVVVPLYFAAGGGFNYDLAQKHYLGFSAQSEQFHGRISAQIEQAAHHLKAFSDPTRLLLLHLIHRYENFPLTVGDLSKQLAVSQPTVSGHLKLLRELGLVVLNKEGNKSLYQMDYQQARNVLEELKELFELL